jgi:hypothetical protein
MVNLDDLEHALSFTALDQGMDSCACLDTATGETILVSPGEEPPADIYNNNNYLLLPTQQELDLGRSLVLQFIQQTHNHLLDDVYAMFRARGAYAKFKALLEREGILAQWYQYERDKTREALKDWCRENNLSYNESV